MRSENEMMELILSKAITDERIRAVILNGSRANPNVKKDEFQDYDIVYLVNDIVYLVNDIDTFTKDHLWVDYFGERVMMQMPEDKILPAADNSGHFVYLIQFMDGNRIDLTLIPIEKMEKLLKKDSLSILLLDKDGMIGAIPPTSDVDYHIRKPTEKEYFDTCNEFWWICMNISKGLCREELSYAMFMHEQINRNVLIRMIEWYIGMKTDYSLSAGKLGKYFKNHLTMEEWDEFVLTYSDANYDNIWTALFTMCDLFRKISKKVATHFKFPYQYEDDKRVTNYLKEMRNLQKR